MADKHICLFLSQRDQEDSEPGITAEVVYETLILPTMERFPDFAMNPRGYIHEPGSISAQMLDELLSADLVIADLTNLSPSGYFQLGVRQAAQLPLVLIAQDDFVMAVAVADFRFVRYPYPFDSSPSSVGDSETIDQLAATIRDALDLRPRMPGGSHLPMKGSSRERRTQLAERIDEAAEVIRLLRINSVGDTVAELNAIANELRAAADEETPSALREAGNNVLRVLSKIADQLSSVRGSRIAISGAIALILGGSGWPAVSAMGLALAYWEGKDTFLKAVETITSGRRRKK
jgi:hypothetical protein